MDFGKIDFGKATGEQEGVDSPLLVKHGFVDKDDVLDKILNKDKFIVLGFKGSGKSSVGEKIRLECYPENTLSKTCVSVNHLADFPFKSFAKICPGGSEPESKYPTAWQYLILTALLDLFSSDPNGQDTENLDFRTSISKLTTTGLLPAKSMRNLAIKASKSSFKINLFQILEYAKESSSGTKDQDILFHDLVDYLRELVVLFKTNSKHILVIDGLDDVLSSRDVQLNSLAALVFEVNRLNLWLRREHLPAKVVLLCRTDLFERLPGANKNKIRQDSAVKLDWYHDPREPSSSQLVSLANLRAKVSLQREVDIFSEFFQPTTEGKPTQNFLLEHTRHTPRDFLQLMNCCKMYFGSEKADRNIIISSIRKYSMDYFLPEIEDEMVGYVEFELLKAFTMAASKLKEREFKYSSLVVAFLGEKYTEADLQSALRALFKCSAIGNKWSHRGTDRYEFVYRNPHAEFDKEKTIVLHKGLWKALNLI